MNTPHRESAQPDTVPFADYRAVCDENATLRDELALARAEHELFELDARGRKTVSAGHVAFAVIHGSLVLLLASGLVCIVYRGGAVNYPTEQGELVLVEYHADGDVIRAVTRDVSGGLQEWSFTPCESDGDTYVEEGCYFPADRVDATRWAVPGQPHPIWYDASITLRRYLKETPDGAEYVDVRDEDLAALGSVRIPDPLTPDPFEDTHLLSDCGGSLEYCTACSGYVRGDRLCNHLTWGDEGLCGPGSDELGRSVPEGFKRVVRLTGCARSLRRQLRTGKAPKTFHMVCVIGRDSVEITLGGRRFSDSFNDLHDLDDLTGVREGYNWISGLGSETGKANKLAMAWLDEEIAEQDARRASGERCYRVRVGRYGDPVTPRVSWATAMDEVTMRRRTGIGYGEAARIVRVVPRGKS